MSQHWKAGMCPHQRASAQTALYQGHADVQQRLDMERGQLVRGKPV